MKNKIQMKQEVREKLRTLDSREVAEMLGKEPKQLMKEIREISEVLTRENFSPVKYFIEDYYKDQKGEKRPCYQVTKMGCELLGNKLQGQKGILFTAKYVEKFNEMEEVQKQSVPKLSKEIQAIFALDIKQQQLEEEITDLKGNMPLFNVECKELQALVRKKGIETLGGYKTPAYNDNSLRTKIYKDIQHQLRREFGVARYESIKRVQLEKANEIIENYKAPIVLQEEIIKANNQINFKGVI